MNTKPILFSGEMIRALLDGRKTQTRRVIKPQPPADCRSVYLPFQIDPNNWQGICTDDLIGWYGRCPYGKPGDLLWVRETIYIDKMPFDQGPLPKIRPPEIEDDDIYYRADGECCQQIPECACAEVGPTPWRPSIHMPRWASRITLKITDVRVQRIQEISADDAEAEGLVQIRHDHLAPISRYVSYQPPGANFNCLSPIAAFHSLWDSINAKRGFGWQVNPWVWALTFEVIRENVDAVIQRLAK